jgi:transcription antitermination protein NusB
VKERSRARGWAVQTLYAWETRGGSEDAIVPILAELTEQNLVSQRNRLYTEVLVRIFAGKSAEIDALIERHLINWTLGRLSVIDRSILRIGVAELLHVEDIPPEITVQEMVRIADRYGTNDSPRFVKGVLEAVARGLENGGATGTR